VDDIPSPGIIVKIQKDVTQMRLSPHLNEWHEELIFTYMLPFTCDTTKDCIMSKPFFHLVSGVALPILSFCLLAACSQSEVQQDVKPNANQDLKAMSASLSEPYMINDKGEVIAEIPPFILQKMVQNLKAEAKLSEASEFERMYDSKTGKLRNLDKLGEIQNQLDKMAAKANMPVMNGVNP
jgi:hypothetical protein